MKRTAICIINWNNYDCTLDCIQSLMEISNKDFDIVLVDNASADGSGDLLAGRFPDIKYLKMKENAGFTGGNNAGINYSLNRKYQYTLLLNNDTLVEPDFLDILVNHLDEHPEVGAIQPKIYFCHDKTLLWNGGSHFNKWTGIDSVEGTGKKSSATSESLKNADWLTGCALLLRNDILPKVGLLDESLFMYYEDVDYSFRIKQAGYSLVYHPESVIYHIAGASSRAKEKGKEGFLNPRIHYYLTRNKIWFLKKYLAPSQWFSAGIITSFYLAGVLSYFLVRRRFEKFRITLKAIRHGLAGNMESKYHFDEHI